MFFAGFICDFLDFLLFGPLFLIESPFGSFLLDLFFIVCLKA